MKHPVSENTDEDITDIRSCTRDLFKNKNNIKLTDGWHCSVEKKTYIMHESCGPPHHFPIAKE